jgi:hypothetical protein
MSALPDFLEMADFPGDDYLSRWNAYVEAIYQVYSREVAYGRLTFRGQPVRCQYRPETNGKHFAFWHMMQEAALGKREEDRTIDLERCRRVRWIAWAIQNAGNDSAIRVFKQAARAGETSWVLWLHEDAYAVILWERNGYFLLKTAFNVRTHKEREFTRDWSACQATRPGNG